MKSTNKRIILLLLRRKALFVDTEKGKIFRTRQARGFLKTPRIVRGTLSRNGYLRSCFNYNGKQYVILLHHIIYLAEYGDILKGMQIHHKNNKKADNKISNLQMLTQSDNMRQANNDGLILYPSGENARGAKLKNTQVNKIRRMYSTGKYYQKHLAKIFGICQSSISRIIRKESYGD